MKLIERDKEISELAVLFGRSLTGDETVAVIRGPIASGKTALLMHLAAHATSSAATFLSATASRIERTLPLGVLNQIFSPGRLPAGAAERAARLLADLDQPGPGPGGAPDRVTRAAATVFGELHRLLLEVSEDQPVVIGIDDLHYADVASAQYLSYLARRPRGGRILLVLSECAQMPPADRVLHAGLLRLPNCRCLPLSLLSPPGVASLLSERLPAATAHRLAPACHAASGGSPPLARAWAEDYHAATGSAPASPVPGEAFRRAYTTCLYRCEPAVADLVHAVAVLPEAPAPLLVGDLLDVSAGSVTQGLSLLTAAGLMDGTRFRHETAREAVLASMSSAELAALHGRAARASYLAGAEPAVLAQHLVTAEGVGGTWAASVLEQAAEQALSDNRPGLAFGYLRRAHADATTDEQRATIKATLAWVQWRTDPARSVRYLPELMAAGRHGYLNGRQLRELLHYLLWRGQTDEAAEVISVLWPAAGRPDSGRPGRGVGAGPVRAWASLIYPEAAGLQDSGTGPEDGTLLALLRAARSDAVAVLAESILEKCVAEEPVQGPALAALIALTCVDRDDRAAFWADSLLRDATAAEIPVWRPVIAGFRALLQARRGNLTAAADQAHSALTLLTHPGWGVAIGSPLASGILAATATGRLDDAAAYLRIPVPAATYGTLYGLLYLYARGTYFLAAGRPRAALEDFQACGEKMIRWQLDLPGFLPWRSQAAHGFLAVGDIRQARELAAGQLTRLRSGDQRARGVTLRVLALASPAAGRPDQLRAAAEALHEAGAWFELAQTFADLSDAHTGLGDTGQAQAAARRARSLAAQCGAELPPGRETGAPPPGGPRSWVLDQLSHAERRVAQLAMSGHTNRQIAAKLGITVSTVEQHLTRVYRKLSVSRRSELSAGFPAGLADSG